MNRRPIELTETPLRSAIVKTTEQLPASYKDYTDSTLRYRETTAIDTTESAVQTTTMNRRPIETTETPLGSAIITQLIQTTTELDSPKDFTNSTLSYQEASKIDATWTVLNTLQIMVTPTHPRPVRAYKVSLSSEVEKTTERLTVNNTQSTKASSITSETRKHTSPIVTVETTDYQTNRVPDNQSAIVLSSAQMATLEITKPRMFIKRITDVTNTSRETTKLKPIPKLVMSIKASTSTTATTNNITTTGKRKTTMNHKPATFANGIGHKLKFTNDVKTTRPNTTSTQVPSNRTFIGLNTQDVSFSNKKLGIYFEDTSYSSVKYLTSTEGSIEIAIVESYDTVTLLVIGLGVGIVIALMIMIVAIYAKHKKRRKEYTLWDREEPIVKNDSIEMDNCGKDSDVDYHFET
ncbi:unnamed protein product [Mytilus edulis]|uniref:Uncharacterized protein n=1 Tax=Mytilus edulis TaxID=6550 RepID=A0A8S3SCV6_MYTED|nr:unnamed protein product [Mytilus edulis]